MTTKLKDVMLDLETLGKRPGCVVLSIGAVRFDHLTVGEDGYYQVVKLSTCREVGLLEDPETLKWWQAQSPEARQVLSDSTRNRCRSLRPVLKDFAKWLGADPVVWGNGSDFDQPILAAAYAACGLLVPWKFYNSRCYRTLKSFAPSVKLKRVGTYHNALDDARSQAEHFIRVLKHLKLELP